MRAALHPSLDPSPDSSQGQVPPPSAASASAVPPSAAASAAAASAASAAAASALALETLDPPHPAVNSMSWVESAPANLRRIIEVQVSN
jgi:uncharacterized protein (DUF2342 family)